MNVKNIFKKENMMPVIVLGIICLVVAGLMGAVNMITAPVIDAAEEQKVYDSLREVIDGTFEPTEIPEGASEAVTGMYKVTEGEALVGHAVTVKVKGYASDILMTVGVDANGAITKVVITSQAESHGKAGMATYTDNYTGVAAGDVASVELFSGATISSTAIKGGIIAAVNAATGGSIEAPGGDTSTGAPAIEIPKTDAELLTLAAELVADSEGFEDVTPAWSKPASLMRLYKETSGKGYVAYIITPGEYVPIANEAMVYIDMNGDVAAINHLQWVVGNAISAEGFAEQFVGKDYWSVGDVELITQATYTSSDLRQAVYDAVEVVTKAIDRTEKKLLELADGLVPNSKGFEAVELPEWAPDTLKKVYRETSGRGYVAYIVTAGQYVAVATESLVYFDTEGRIKDMDILVWTVGHGVEPGDFAESFVGLTAEDMADVELVASATTTSADLRNAVAAAMPYIPTDFPTARVVGAVVIALAVLGTAVAVIFVKRRRK